MLSAMGTGGSNQNQNQRKDTNKQNNQKNLTFNSRYKFGEFSQFAVSKEQ